MNSLPHDDWLPHRQTEAQDEPTVCQKSGSSELHWFHQIQLGTLGTTLTMDEHELSAGGKYKLVTNM